ncbi:MAG: glycosyltransferase family 4 protein [Candidatus Latescibacteria bacterium]|nr:glycosyltransferase family 4 protein [Candidatus Latescibacterota bacterium]
MSRRNGKVIGAIGLRGFPHVMGGVERHCEQLYPRLASLGFRLYICRRSNYLTEKSRCYKHENIDFIDLWVPKQKHMEAIYHSFIGLILLKVKGVKVLHIHSFGPAIVAPIAKMLGFSVVMTYHLPNYYQGKWNNFDRLLLRMVENVACLFSDTVITVSKTNQTVIKENTGKDSVVIPNGVNLPAHIDSDITSYHLTKKRFIFSACRFVPEKGVDLLLKAFNKLNTDWKLVIAGTADHVSKYSLDVFATAKKNSNIILPGFITGAELDLFYSNAGIFVLPSFIEGQPIALLEAMSHGLPVVVSDIPAHRELEIEERCFFKSGDVNNLAEKLNEFMHDGKLLDSGRKYRELVSDKYNWDSIALNTGKIFDILFKK